MLNKRLTRLLIGLIVIAIFGWSMIQSGRIAIARVFTKYETTVLNSSPADAAIAAISSVEMTPRDAEVHYTRGEVLTYMQDAASAVKEFEQAVSLRPKDYYFWLELGLARNELGDDEGALFAFNQSMRLAPYYAQPRWLRGNLLFRMGRYEEAFNDLRLATRSNPDYLPAFTNLAWGASKQNPELTKQLLQPQSEKDQSELALFFAKNRKPDEAVAEFKLLRGDTTETRRKLVRELLSAGAIKPAFDIWSMSGNSAGKAAIFDGGFEGTLNLDESGFGWRLAPATPGLDFSIDGGRPQSGSRSLRITFSGNVNPALELISQLVVVDPKQKYRLHFALITENLVTGGRPQMMIADSSNQQVLARSAVFPSDSHGWQTLSTDFITGEQTNAIRIFLRREECSSSPCPVFGTANLDSFSLEAVNNVK